MTPSSCWRYTQYAKVKAPLKTKRYQHNNNKPPITKRKGGAYKSFSLLAALFKVNQRLESELAQSESSLVPWENSVRHKKLPPLDPLNKIIANETRKSDRSRASSPPPSYSGFETIWRATCTVIDQTWPMALPRVTFVVPCLSFVIMNALQRKHSVGIGSRLFKAILDKWSFSVFE